MSQTTATFFLIGSLSQMTTVHAIDGVCVIDDQHFTCEPNQICTEKPGFGRCGGNVGDKCNAANEDTKCGFGIDCLIDKCVITCVDGGDAISECEAPRQTCTKENGTGVCGGDAGAKCSDLSGTECGFGLECLIGICKVASTVTTDAPNTDDPKTDGPAPKNPKECQLSVDNDEYCKCPPPVVTSNGEIEISVCGDATFLIPKGSVHCSGETLLDGAVCPSKDDTTTLACKDRDIMSFFNGGKTGTCKAPADAECLLLNTGVYGCIFPGNANTVNQCLDTIPVNEDYQVDDKGEVVTGDNGYPIPTEKAVEAGKVVDTANYTSPVQSQSSEKSVSGAFSTSVHALATTSLLAIILLATL